jgi:deazaflavin-dependent oxidoreductase (nitroreductase family)
LPHSPVAVEADRLDSEGVLVKVVRNASLPSGLTRVMLRIPIYLFRLGLGRLFGERLLLLNHTGRITGKSRRTVLEVVDHDSADDTYVVASGWGLKAAWYRNVLEYPDVTIEVGARTLAVTAIPPGKDEGAEIFVQYAARHRSVARYMLPCALGVSVDGSDADFRAAGKQLPFVRFIPRSV